MPLLAGKKVVITGAAGFLGRAVVKACVTEGANVTVLLRSKHAVKSMTQLGATAIQAPLTRGPALDAGLTGQDVVIHLAYDVRDDAAANLAAFEAVYQAANKAGATRFVQASSVAVYDDWPSNGVLTEDSPIGQTPAHGYRAAKIEMSRRVLDGPMPATILEPTIIWGPGGELWTDGPMTQLKDGGMVLPSPCGAAPLLHVDDAARAFVLAAAQTHPQTARYLISGPDTPGWDALLQGYADIVGGTLLREDAETLKQTTPAPVSSGTGQPSLAAKVSKALRGVLGRDRFQSLLKYAASLRPQKGPFRPDSFRLRLYSSTPSVPCDRAKTELGFAPEVGLPQGLDQLRKQYLKKT